MVLLEFGAPGGPTLAERLLEEVSHYPEMIKERELSTAQRAVHRVLAMFESHYLGLDRMVLSGGWAPGISDAQFDELEEDYATFARDMADAALKDLDLLPEDTPEVLESSRPSS
jgi:hypothetical protein